MNYVLIISIYFIIDRLMTLENQNSVLIIAEAGSNWKCGTYNDDIERAKKLIDIASRSGCDAIKFQTFRPETLYVKNAGSSDYLSKQGMKSDIYEIFEDLSMPYDMIPKLADYCQKNKIKFMSTPFSVEDAKQVDPYVEIHKVASYENNHIRLLEFLADTKKPTFVSTGASGYEEINFLVENFQNNDSLRLMQCTAKYPCPIEDLNLSVISHLNSKYNVPVGLSDHSTDPILAPAIAVAYGAIAIEKHFTLDKTLPGPDHSFALNPNELKLMVQSIRKAENSVGSGIKNVLDIEKELSSFARRSIQATTKIRKGDEFVEGVNFDILRPGKKSRGIEPRFLNSLNGKKAKIDIDIGEGITENS